MTHSLRFSILVVLACGAPFPAATQARPDSTARHPVRLRFYDAGKWGYLDASGAVVIPPQFTNAMDYFQEGFARVQTEPDRSAKWTYVHTSGRILGAARFDGASDFVEGRASVAVGDKWGVIDTSGAFIVEPRYRRPVHFLKNRAAVPIDGKFGYIDGTGTVVIPARFTEAHAFKHGVAAVKVGNQWGLIDTAGQDVLEPRHVLVFPMAPDRFAVRIERQWRLMDRAGQIIGPAIEEIYFQEFSEGLAPVKRGGKAGYVDRSGTLVVPAEWDIPGTFSNGRALVRKEAWRQESSPPNMWGFIDRRGTVVGRFREAQPFTEGLAAVSIGGRWGYIDTAGAVAIAPEFAEARAFSQGVANVTFSDQSWGYIDRAGHVIWRSAPGPGRAVVADSREGAAASTDTSALAGAGPLVDRLARLIERLEVAEQRGQLNVVAFGPTPLLPAIVGADRRVRAYVDSHPGDARLAVLAARLGRLKHVAEPVIFSAENPPSLAAYNAGLAPYLAYLGRALAIAPNDAGAHYWMARLHGMSFSSQRLFYGGEEPPDSAAAFFRAAADSTLAHARRAVELASQQVPYREALALYLVMADRPNDAVEVVRDVAGGRHPIYLLLSDWRLLPIPPGAVPGIEQARIMASMQQARGQDYAELRVRAYILPVSAAEVERFYRTQWPTLRLFDAEDEELQGTDARMLMQFLHLKDQRGSTSLEPTRTKRDVQRLAEAEQPPDGFLLSLIEITKPDEEMRARLRVAVGDTFCVLTVLNTRRIRR